MRKLYKFAAVAALTIALTACSNETSSAPEPPILSNSGESSVNSAAADGSSGSAANNTYSVSTESSESSSDTKTESTASSISSVNSSSTTENEPLAKENPGMFDLNSKTVTLNSGYTS